MYKNHIKFLVATRNVEEEMENSNVFKNDVLKALRDFQDGDWGIIPQEDKAMNDYALAHNDGGLFAAYPTIRGKIWIITEADRSCTTVLFPNEY